MQKVSRGEAVDYRSSWKMSDGVWCMRIEFRVGNTEYEYEIDAETGRIISAEKETKNEAAGGGEVKLTGSSGGSQGAGARRTQRIAGEGAGMRAGLRGRKADI